MSTSDSPLLSLGPKIRTLPVIYGSGDFARLVRREILSGDYDCLALPLPSSFQASVEKGTHGLPVISAAFQEEKGAEAPTYSFVPVDPCQPVIAGLRVALQEGISRAYIDLEVKTFEPLHAPFPDPYALKSVPLEKFAAAVLPYLKRPARGSQHDLRARWMAYRLHILEMSHRRIFFPCSLLDWVWVREAYLQRLEYPKPASAPSEVRLFPLHPDSLYFATGELPFVTHLYEKRREDLLSDRNLSIDGIKELLIESRKKWKETYNLEHHNISPQTFQTFLQYVRNLALLERRLSPDLYTLAMAAKQIAGDGFAIALVETAKKYPYQDEAFLHIDKEEAALLGMGEGLLPDTEAAVMKNRLAGVEMAWRTIPLKPPPPELKKKAWKMRWNPLGCCSWPPEDKKIESFNSHVREQAKALLGEDHALSEKFTTSVKDGIDIRETLRQWHTGDIYVKEIPPNRGNVEVVVMVFDPKADPEKYAWRETWFAEHEEESTLCFFATPYMEEVVGPGISRSRYGGFFLLYPPRYIPNIWQDPRFDFTKTLEERLIAGAVFHSQERNVVVVSPQPPLRRWRWIARCFKKHLIHIPLKRFSMRTQERVRNFHVLNGKEVRSHALPFIRDF